MVDDLAGARGAAMLVVHSSGTFLAFTDHRDAGAFAGGDHGGSAKRLADLLG